MTLAVAREHDHGTSAKGMPKESTTWLSTSAAVGFMPAAKMSNCRKHRDGAARQQGDPDPMNPA